MPSQPKALMIRIRTTNRILNNHPILPTFFPKKQDEVTRKNVPVY